MVTTATVCAIASFLLGGVPFGLLLGKLKGIDIRTIGSGNIGATNVTRALGRRWGITAFLLDFLKGLIPVVATGAILAASSTTPPAESPAFGLLEAKILSGVAAVLGHIFPVYLRFRGGKGVATTLGVLIAIAWPVGVLSCLTWLAVAAAFRISSLSAIVSLALSPVYAWWLADAQRVELAGLLAVIVILRHHANIRRLIKGEEPKIALGDE